MWPYRNLAEFSVIAEQLFDHYSVEPPLTDVFGDHRSSSLSSSSPRGDGDQPQQRYVTSFEVSLAIEVLFGFVPTSEEVRSAMQDERVKHTTSVSHTETTGWNDRSDKSTFTASMCNLALTLSIVPHTSTRPWQDELWNAIDRRGRGFVAQDDIKSLQDEANAALTVFPQLVSSTDLLQASRALAALSDHRDGRVAGCDLRAALVGLASASLAKDAAADDPL
jgi:hypothetical protein